MKAFCHALLHRDGPKLIRSIDFSCEPNFFCSGLFSRGAVNNLGDSGIEEICNVLVHPEKPKNITKISVAGTWE